MKYWFLSSLVLAAGCFSPIHTRLPTLANRSPDVERQSFNLHDPLPERDVGPDTQVRPRGFNEQRSEPRRTLDGRGLIGTPQIPGSALPPVGSQYPDVVPQ